MKKAFNIFFVITFFLIAKYDLLAQNFSPEDFTGKWYGTIESEWQYYREDIEITLYPDGTYEETSGRLMPSIYPNTQTWDIDYENNRLHFQYLSVVYAGRRSYQHFYYDIVDFTGDMFELHYNFWNDPEPNPDAQKLILSRSITSVGEKFSNENRMLIKVFDMYGRELPLDTKSIPAIYLYDDGSIEKKLIDN